MTGAASAATGTSDPMMLLPLLGVVAVVLLALLFGTRFLEPARTRRLLRRLKRSDIGTAGEGPIKIVGTLKLVGQPLRAPLSERKCALWDVVVTERQNQSAHTIIEDRLAVDFLLDDGTGVALVRAARSSGAASASRIELAIVQDAKYASGVLKDPTPELSRFLARYEEKSQGLVFNRALSYREGVFEPGERIAVYGRAHREPDPDAAAKGGGYRERPTRLVIEPLAGKLHLSDDPSVTDDR